ncbi:50S ribosomal protein L3 [Mesomycoplasma lagogenitalium]|uniref:Large ribosomal subunit protein uL3 n=1 Tax=Mesomycoplasma lagogenitalium TaxID=171286 RepID=A0ABY8LWB9_9BACT|nr:50S ribosomal protein L3 [Mesomycoplasma lagogenitalium]WGI36588.1 50S ribosomal protein L3 [Mesomycoplasma lagogenitalium]
MKGILGKKVGMTQLYTDSGALLPVTVIEVQPNVVTQVFTKDKDGYDALQLGLENKKNSRQTKPEQGHFKKANTTPKRFVKEIRGMNGFELGQTVDSSIFSVGDLVDVTGTSKGKGFAGTIKRYNQAIGPKSHGGGGGSQPIRQTGSLGDISGNKVVKGMTMPGQLGNVKTTIQNLEIIKIDVKNNILVVKGSIPGPKKSYVVIKSSAKQVPSKEGVKLVNLAEAIEKNHLFEQAKKYNVELHMEMSLEEMKKIIDEAEKKAEEENK